jgi:DNA-binding MarR family transcriptional regulator
MVARGLITKCPDPDDGRGALVKATAEGASLFHNVAKAHGQSICDRMSVLSDDELAELRSLTSKLRGVAEG